MSIATVVTMGYGSSGGVRYVPTLGYDILEVLGDLAPSVDVAMAVRGGAVAVAANLPNNVVCHTAGKSAPAVCVFPRLGYDGTGV